MDVPNLDRIVEAHVPVDLGQELAVLRENVLPGIRSLERTGRLRWFSFLLHPLFEITARESDKGSVAFRLRLEPAEGISLDAFIADLPPVFREPRHTPSLGRVAGVALEQLKDQDWAYAWRMLGESSAWVLQLVEVHKEDLTLAQALQFLHLVTNPIGIGGRCVWIAQGVQF